MNRLYYISDRDFNDDYIDDTDNDDIDLDDDMEVDDELELLHQKQTENEELFGHITTLYDNVIESFRQNEFIIYNPDIFFHLSKEKFMDWVILNNPELKEKLLQNM